MQLQRCLREHLCQFAPAVGPVVEEKTGVVFANQADGFVLFIDNGYRLDELVGYTCFIRPAHYFHRVRVFPVVAHRHGPEGPVYAFPALVTVHCVVSADDGCDGADTQFRDLVLKLADVIDATLRGSVAPVGETVNKYFGHAFALRHFQQRVEMLELRVNAAIAAEAHQMESVSLTGVMHCRAQHRVGEEFTGGNHEIDAGYVHMDNASGTNIHMAHFAVPHLAFRQAHEGTGSVYERVGEIAQQHVVSRLARGGDGVAPGGRRETPAVKNCEDERFIT